MTVNELIDLLSNLPAHQRRMKVCVASMSDYVEADRVQEVVLVERGGFLSTPYPLASYIAHRDNYRKMMEAGTPFYVQGGLDNSEKMVRMAEEDYLKKQTYLEIA